MKHQPASRRPTMGSELSSVARGAQPCLQQTKGPHLHAHADAADPHAHVAAQPRGVKGAGVRLNGDLHDQIAPSRACRGLNAAWHGLVWCRRCVGPLPVAWHAWSWMLRHAA